MPFQRGNPKPPGSGPIKGKQNKKKKKKKSPTACHARGRAGDSARQHPRPQLDQLRALKLDGMLDDAVLPLGSHEQRPLELKRDDYLRGWAGGVFYLELAKRTKIA